MTFPAKVPEMSRALPPLSGGVLAAYATLWALLTAVALGLLALSFLEPDGSFAILALRACKAAVLLAVSAILLRRRRHDPVAAILSLAFLLWVITSSFDFTGAAGSLPILLDRLRFLLFAVALLLFPNADWRPRWTRALAIASFAIFLVGVAESIGILPTRLFLPLAIGCVLLAIVALIQRFRKAVSQTERQQLKWVALGLVSGVGLILTARGGAALDHTTPMPPFEPVVLEGLFQLGIILVALGFLVSLLRYRLFDAEAAITHSAAYAGLTLALVGTFAGSEALIETLGEKYLGMGIGDISAAMAAAIAAVVLTPLHNRITAWAEQRFERDLAILKQQLPELLAELSAGSTTRELASAALPKILDAIHATGAALVVGDTVVASCGVEPRSIRSWPLGSLTAPLRGSFDRQPSDKLFPVRMAMRCPFGTVRGWLLLGPRPDGTLYGSHELEALEAIAPALRQALFETSNRDAERNRERRLYRAINCRIVRLSDRLDALSSRAPQISARS